MLQTELVLANVVRVQIAWVETDGFNEKSQRVIAAGFERCRRSGCHDDMPEREEWAVQFRDLELPVVDAVPDVPRSTRPDYLVKPLFLPWDAQLPMRGNLQPTPTSTPTPTRILQLSQRSLLIHPAYSSSCDKRPLHVLLHLARQQAKA